MEWNCGRQIGGRHRYNGDAGERGHSLQRADLFGTIHVGLRDVREHPVGSLLCAGVHGIHAVRGGLNCIAFLTNPRLNHAKQSLASYSARKFSSLRRVFLTRRGLDC